MRKLRRGCGEKRQDREEPRRRLPPAWGGENGGYILQKLETMETSLRGSNAAQRWQYYNQPPGVLYVKCLKNAEEYPLSQPLSHSGLTHRALNLWVSAEAAEAR